MYIHSDIPTHHNSAWEPQPVASSKLPVSQELTNCKTVSLCCANVCVLSCVALFCVCECFHLTSQFTFVRKQVRSGVDLSACGKDYVINI